MLLQVAFDKSPVSSLTTVSYVWQCAMGYQNKIKTKLAVICNLAMEFSEKQSNVSVTHCFYWYPQIEMRLMSKTIFPKEKLMLNTVDVWREEI